MNTSSSSRPHCFEKEGDVSPWPSLSELEFEALKDLDESIGYFEENDEQFMDEHAELPKILEPGALFSLHRAQMFSEPQRRINAGYIIFDGVEMKYVDKDASPETFSNMNRMTELNNTVLDESTRSSASWFTHLSEPQIRLNISSDELLAEDSLKSYDPPIVPTVSRRIPTRAFLSCIQKSCMFVTGVATVSAFSAFYVSLAYFTSFLGDSVLSSIGLCHYLATLFVMAFVFCSKKHLWIPFLPTVPLCLAFMAAIVAVIPATAAAGVQVPALAILGLVTLNGLCSGMSHSLVSRMIVLFPGGKSTLLVTCGRGLGSLLPAVIQMVLILSQGLEPDVSAQRSYKEFCLFVLFPLLFLVILVGLLSLLRFSRSGIYELFAGKDCAAHSPKNITIGTVPDTAKRRFRQIRLYLLAEFLVAAVSFYVLSLAPQVHGAALRTENSTFWRHYLSTVLVGLFKFGDWFGEVVSMICCQPKTNSTRCLPVVYFTVSAFRLGFVAIVVVFIRQPFPVYHNLFAMIIFFLLAVSNGYLTVAMVSHCQSLCGVRARDSCPIVSQLTCLSIHMGAAVGIAFSFVPLR